MSQGRIRRFPVRQLCLRRLPRRWCLNCPRRWAGRDGSANQWVGVARCSVSARRSPTLPWRFTTSIQTNPEGYQHPKAARGKRRRENLLKTPNRLSRPPGDPLQGLSSFIELAQPAVSHKNRLDYGAQRPWHLFKMILRIVELEFSTLIFELPP